MNGSRYERPELAAAQEAGRQAAIRDIEATHDNLMERAILPAEAFLRGQGMSITDHNDEATLRARAFFSGFRAAVTERDEVRKLLRDAFAEEQTPTPVHQFYEF